MGWNSKNCYGIVWDRKICPMDKPAKSRARFTTLCGTDYRWLLATSMNDRRLLTDVIFKKAVCFPVERAIKFFLWAPKRF